MNHTLKNGTAATVVSLSNPSAPIWKLTRMGIMHNITTLSEGKYIFTSIALSLFLIFLVFQVEFNHRRQFQDIRNETREIKDRVLDTERTILEFKAERERREVVLRVEIGRAKEEIMELKNELARCKDDMRREREIDRSVDMEEKLCLIRGLKEIAGVKEGEDVEIPVEELKGLGIGFGSAKWDEEVQDDVSDSTESGAEDEEELQRSTRESEEAWEKFDWACHALGSELELGEQQSGEESRRTSNPERQYELIDGVLIDPDAIESECDGTPETQGERLFPLRKKYPPVRGRGYHRRNFTDPGIEAQLNNIFELE